MFRIFVRQLILKQPPVQSWHSNNLKNIVNTSLCGRYCSSTNVNETNEATSENVPEIDAKTIKQIQSTFKCTPVEAENIFHQIDILDLKSLRKKYMFLVKQGATHSILMEHCYLLNESITDLSNKFALLNYLPWKKTDDFIPFLAVNESKLKLRKIRDLTDRVYYLSEKMNIDAPVVSKYLAKHSFMWEMSFDLMKKKLEILMSYEEYLSPMNILRDLHIIQRSEESIHARLNRLIASSAVKKAMPWMVKCKKSVLDRSIELRIERGDFINFLAKRLEWSIKTINWIHCKFPLLKNYQGSYNDANEVLEKILPLVGAEAITKNIKIVMVKPKVIAMRCRDLEAAGIPINETSLRLFCVPHTRFERYLDLVKWKQKKSQI